MKLKEVLQKVTENLNMEKDLKSRIKSAEKKVVEFEEKLANSKEKLENGYVKLEELNKTMLLSSQQYAECIPDNLDSRITLNDNEEVVASLEYSFMGNKYKLIDDQYVLIVGKGGLETAEAIKEVHNKYLEVGKKLFNAESINKLQDISTLYHKNPKKVTAGFEKLKLANIVKGFEDNVKLLRADYDNKIEELDKIEEKIQKAKVFKSPLMKKIFSKREKLEEKQNKLFDETNDLCLSLKANEMELADRSQMENDAKKYVEKEIGSLIVVLQFIKGFEIAKLALADDENRYIDYVKQEIQDLDKGLLDAKLKVEDLKTMLKSNKKVIKETIAMAFKDNQFGRELDNVNPKNIAKEDIEAYELLQAKYDQIISAKIKKIM